MEEIRDRAISIQNIPSQCKRGSSDKDNTVLQRYMDKVFSIAKLPEALPNFRIAIDAGNGMNGMILPVMQERLKLIEIFDLYWDLDGSFPNHEANPLKEETLKDLKSSVLEHHCEFGVTFDGEPRSESLGRACDELAWRVEVAQTSGVTFAIEAHVGSIVSRPRAALALLEKVPGLTLTLDYTHFTKLGIPDAEIEPLLSHATHFHARGARKGRLQTSFGSNSIDYGRIARRLQKTDYRGFIGIEYVWIDWEHCNEVDNLSEIVLFRDFFRSS